MSRPITLASGQWADLKLDDLAAMMKDIGYDGLELTTFGDHFDVGKALSEPDYCDKQREKLEKHGLRCWAISAHAAGQCVLDLIDESGYPVYSSSF